MRGGPGDAEREAGLIAAVEVAAEALADAIRETADAVLCPAGNSAAYRHANEVLERRLRAVIQTGIRPRTATRVRVAVLVTEAGNWCSPVAYDDDADQDQIERIDCYQEAEQRHIVFVEADVPLPSPKTVKGVVGDV